jgi:hypothetical protein
MLLSSYLGILVIYLSLSYLLRPIYIGCGRLTLGFRGSQLNQTLGSNYAIPVNATYMVSGDIFEAHSLIIRPPSIDWLIMMGWLCLRTAATNGPIVHPPGDMWTWRGMVMVIPAGNNSWLVHQSSLTLLPAEASVASRRNRQAVPWLRSLAAGLSPRRPGFAPGWIHVGFVVDKVALGQVFLQVLRFSPVSISFHRRSPNSHHLGNA